MPSLSIHNDTLPFAHSVLLFVVRLVACCLAVYVCLCESAGQSMYRPRIGVTGYLIFAVFSVASILLYCPIMIVVARLVRILKPLQYNIISVYIFKIELLRSS